MHTTDIRTAEQLDALTPTQVKGYEIKLRRAAARQGLMLQKHLLAAHSNYVRDGWQGHDHIAPDRRYLTTVGVGAYSTSGVIGYPSRATAAKGHAVLDHLGQAAYALITLLTSEST